MRNYVFAVLILLLSGNTTKSQNITPEYLIGKWLFTDSASGFVMSHHFMDRENFIMAMQNRKENSGGASQNGQQNFKYKLNKKDSVTMMTFTNSIDTFRFVLVYKGVNALLLYTPEDYKTFQEAKKLPPGTIAWGLNKPLELEIKRQVEK